MRSDIFPAGISHLPIAIRRQVSAQCDGDWSRVTLDSAGGVVVHNRPQPGGLSVPLRPPRRPRKPQRSTVKVPDQAPIPALATPPPPERRHRGPELAPVWLAPTAPAGPEQLVLEVLPVQPLRSTAPPRLFHPEIPVAPAPDQWVIVPGVTDEHHWAEDLPKLSMALIRAIAQGVGPDCPVALHVDVAALRGVDLDQVEQVVRQADKVELDRSTVVKGYPIVKFYRDRAMVVAGFRQPGHPMVIAAYMHGLALAARGPTPLGGPGRVPTTVSQLVRGLHTRGATVSDGVGNGAVAVTYRGHDLGRITVGPAATPDTVSHDYRRCLRRITAISGTP